MLDVIELDFDYQDQPLLHQVSFSVPAGGLLHLKGANGAGKTTLLKLIAGLYHPRQGDIYFAGQSVMNNSQAYQSQLCFIGHKLGLNPGLTLMEHCFFDLHYGSWSPKIHKLAAVFNLQAHLHSPCGLLSAGQKRQVALLRLWMTKAKLWLLDEPLVALDEAASTLLMAKIAAHRTQGGVVLLSSHQSLPLNTPDYQEYFL